MWKARSIRMNQNPMDEIIGVISDIHPVVAPFYQASAIFLTVIGRVANLHRLL